MDAKKKRLLIVVGVIGGFLLLSMIIGSQQQGKQTEKFNANKEQVLSDLRTALANDDLVKASIIEDEYSLVEDYEFKGLVADYKSKVTAQKQADKEAKDQAEEASKYARTGELFSGDILEIVVKEIRITDKVGGHILGESSQKGILYFVCKYSYKNISKSPTREQPTLSLISPDGATYSPDVSAGVAAANASDDYNEEVFSELQPQVHSNGIEVFEVPSNVGEKDGWKLEIIFEDGGFSSGVTKLIPFTK